jgi:hypothetical protein
VRRQAAIGFNLKIGIPLSVSHTHFSLFPNGKP